MSKIRFISRFSVAVAACLSLVVSFSQVSVQAESGEVPASNTAGQLAAGRISVGGNFACVVMSGSVYCWGENDAGQLGVVDGVNRNTALKITGISNAVSVAAGDDHACALLSTGRVSCWGSNATKQLGSADTSINGPNEVIQLTDATAVTSGTGFSCAISTSNGAVCWGAALKGQLGVQISGLGGNNYNPQLVTGLRTGVVSIAAGVSHACAVESDGNVWCWGTATQDDLVGYLGNVTSQFSEYPVQVRVSSGGAPAYVVDAVSVSAGSGHTCALRSGGGIFCWGTDSYGKMGNSTTGSLNRGGGGTVWAIPVLATTGQGAQAFSGGESASLGDEHSCALVTGATVKCWGLTLDGRIGNGTGTASSNVGVAVPAAVTGLTNIAAVSAGSTSTCVLTTVDTVYCWGKGLSGQIGNAAALSSNTAKLVTAAADPGLSFGSLTTKALTDAPFTVAATASSGATPTFSSTTSSVCTVSGSTVTIVAAGTCTVKADVVANGFYTAGSTTQSFEVSGGAAIVTTVAASSISSAKATLNALVNPNGDDAAVSFVLATSADLLTDTKSITARTVSGNAAIEVSTSVSDLVEEKTYYFQAAATNASGTVKGEVKSFTTGRPLGVSINDAAEFTNKKSVIVSVTGPAGSVKAILSNDGGFKSSETFDLVDASADIKWTLVSSRDERLPKIVYVKYVSRFGNTSTTASTDDIILDTTAPVLAAATAAASAAPAAAVTVQAVRAPKKNGAKILVKASDKNSGVGVIEVRSSAKKKPTTIVYAKPKAASQWVTVKTTAKTLQVRVLDRAGNPSPWKTVRVK